MEVTVRALVSPTEVILLRVPSQRVHVSRGIVLATWPKTYRKHLEIPLPMFRVELALRVTLWGVMVPNVITSRNHLCVDLFEGSANIIVTSYHAAKLGRVRVQYPEVLQMLLY